MAFSIENIGVNCSQDVSSVLDSIFSNLFAADDIPRDRLESIIHSKDAQNLDADVNEIMKFLDDSQTTFKSKLENVNLVDKELAVGLTRSYTLDSEALGDRRATIPAGYRDKDIPLPPINPSYQVDEAMIKQNNLISPEEIFGFVDDLTIAQNLRQGNREVKSRENTLNQATSSMLAKQHPKVERTLTKLKRKPMKLKSVGKNKPETVDTNPLRYKPHPPNRLLTVAPPFQTENQCYFVCEPTTVEFKEWQVGKVYAVLVRCDTTYKKVYRMEFFPYRNRKKISHVFLSI